MEFMSEKQSNTDSINNGSIFHAIMVCDVLTKLEMK